MKYYYQQTPIHLIVAAVIAALGFFTLRGTALTQNFGATRLYLVCFFFATGCVLYISMQMTAFKERKRHLRGTKMVSGPEFSDAVAGDGIAVPNNASGNTPDYLQIRKDDENKHILVCGDTGSGKSAIFHYFAHQIRMRSNELVVFYDPKLEYWKYHGRPERGDILLYPFSKQCPYWDLAAEINRPELSKLIAESLLPSNPGDSPFFIRSSRAVLTQLLQKMHSHRGTIDELIHWTTDSVIDDLLDPDTAQNVLSSSPGQRSGVLGSLSDCAANLKLLPRSHGRSRFSFTHWVKNRPGWLFIGGAGVSDQQILQPVFSIWLNILIQQLLDTTSSTPPATWLFIDEIASLKSLSFLEQAASQARGYNTRLVLGFQNKFQIESLYEKMAQPILSAPKTKIFLRTAEIDSAEWVARTIGEPEFEQRIMSESSQLSLDRRQSISYRQERKTEYLVLPSELLTLGDREGYLQYQGIVTPIAFNYPQLTEHNKVKRSSSTVLEPSMTKWL